MNQQKHSRDDNASRKRVRSKDMAKDDSIMCLLSNAKNKNEMAGGINLGILALFPLLERVRLKRRPWLCNVLVFQKP